MSSLLNRAVAYFVATESVADPVRRAERAGRAAHGPPTAGVLGALEDVGPLAALLSAELRLSARAGCVLLAGWDAGERPEVRSGIAARQAHQLAGRLSARGLDAGARGRLATIRLPAEPEAAAAAWRRGLAAAECPSVWALAGPRPVQFEPLLGELDLIVLVPGAVASAELGRLALAGLAGTSAVVVTSHRTMPSGIARALATSSIATSRLLGTEVVRAVRALS